MISRGIPYDVFINIHALRGSSVINDVLVLEGKINGGETCSWTRRNLIDGIKEWTNVKDWLDYIDL